VGGGREKPAPFHDSVRGEPRRDGGDGVAYFFQSLHLHARLFYFRKLVGALEPLPVTRQPVPRFRDVVPAVLELLFQRIEHGLLHSRDFIPRKRPIRDELLRVLVKRADLLFNRLVHQRLRKVWGNSQLNV